MKFTLDLGDIYFWQILFCLIPLVVFSASKLRKQIKVELQKN